MRGFVDYLMEMLEPIGAVRARRMFGGHGLYSGDVMFGIVVNDTLYLKVDDQTRPRFESMALEPFTYVRKGKPVTIASFYTAPADALEDSELLCQWARDALAAASHIRSQKVPR